MVLNMNLNHSITIKAPLEKVWKTTIDIANWHTWSPMIESISLNDQSFILGSSAVVKQPGMSKTTWTVTEFKSGESFTWETSLLGMKLIATHQLHKLTSEQTKNELYIEVKGLLGKILWPLLRGQFQKALILENEGLKKHCEKI